MPFLDYVISDLIRKACFVLKKVLIFCAKGALQLILLNTPGSWYRVRASTALQRPASVRESVLHSSWQGLPVWSSTSQHSSTLRRADPPCSIVSLISRHSLLRSSLINFQDKFQAAVSMVRHRVFLQHAELLNAIFEAKFQIHFPF